MYNNAAFYPIRETRDIRDLLRQSVDLYGDRPAFRLKNSEGEFYSVTYKTFLREINCLGTKLIRDGFKDVRIAVMGANSYKWMLSYMAAEILLGDEASAFSKGANKALSLALFNIKCSIVCSKRFFFVLK